MLKNNLLHLSNNGNSANNKLVAVLFLESEVNMNRYSIQSIKSLFNNIGKCITFLISCNEDKISTDIYGFSPYLLDVKTQYTILHKLADTYEEENNIKFNNIFITKVNTIIDKSIELTITDKYITTISNIGDFLQGSEYPVPEKFSVIDSIQLHSELYYTHNDKLLNIKEEQIPQKFISSVLLNIIKYSDQTL